jgi:hypothetical protein
MSSLPIAMYTITFSVGLTSCPKLHAAARVALFFHKARVRLDVSRATVLWAIAVVAACALLNGLVC